MYHHAMFCWTMYVCFCVCLYVCIYADFHVYVCMTMWGVFMCMCRWLCGGICLCVDSLWWVFVCVLTLECLCVWMVMWGHLYVCCGWCSCVCVCLYGHIGCARVMEAQGQTQHHSSAAIISLEPEAHQLG